jgi:glycosyltransferase involved in cell wall biosynthesis
MTFKSSDIHLVLFLSRATPLRRWDEMGILDRELAIYKTLAPNLAGISILTCGGIEELKYQSRIGDIQILYNRWGLPANFYSLLAPFLHKSALQNGTVYKTNQLDGSWTAINAGTIYRKPVIVRAGYLWAELNRQSGAQGPKAYLIDRLQTNSFSRAEALFVTTSSMKRQVIRDYNVSPRKIKVVPNYVDTDIFRPMINVTPIEGRVCYVGRLHKIKNLESLIKASTYIPEFSLVFIGQGDQRSHLERVARDYQVSVRFLGALPHNKIPFELNRSSAFILPSLSEGHPKALIEAMSCGLPVIGTDIPGIRDVIQHCETGLLCSPKPDSIRESIQKIIDNPELATRLGQNARHYAMNDFSLNRIVEIELNAIREVTNSY